MRDSERKSIKHAKTLRRSMTDAEIILWSRLRMRAAGAVRFRRQHPIGPCIADFACVMPRLVVEVDGGTHGSDAELENDRKRELYMKSRGWRVFRVTNEDVYKRLDTVLEGIFLHMPPPRRPARLPPLRRDGPPP